VPTVSVPQQILAVIEIEAGYHPVGARVLGLFLDRAGITLLVKLDDTVPLWVFDMVSENGRADFRSCGGPQQVREAVTEMDIVA
jgi:hypothetical protein